MTVIEVPERELLSHKFASTTGFLDELQVNAEEAHHLMSNVRRSKEMVASKSIHHFALSIDSFIDRLIDLI